MLRRVLSAGLLLLIGCTVPLAVLPAATNSTVQQQPYQQPFQVALAAPGTIFVDRSCDGTDVLQSATAGNEGEIEMCARPAYQPPCPNDPEGVHHFHAERLAPGQEAVVAGQQFFVMFELPRCLASLRWVCDCGAHALRYHPVSYDRLPPFLQGPNLNCSPRQ